MTSSQSSRGKRGEEIATEYLISNGHKILARNFRTRLGEVDIVCVDGSTVVFVEVKSYHTLGLDVLEYAVDQKKQRRIISAAREFLARSHLTDTSAIRFDVLYVDLRSQMVKQIQNAFER